MAPKKISAKEVLIDIRAGMSNVEIANKYGISAEGTQHLFDKLLAANLLAGEERQRLSASSPPTLELIGGNGGRAALKQEVSESAESSFAKTQLLPRFEDDEKSHQVASTTAYESVEPAATPSLSGHEIQEAPVTEPLEFLDLAKRGKNQWWRYVLSILFIVIFPTVVTGIAMIVFAPKMDVDKTTGLFTGVDPFVNYILPHIVYVLMFFSIFLVVRAEHERPFLSLITPDQSIDWKKVGKGFGIFVALLAIVAAVDYALDPASFQFSLNPGRFLWFAAAVLILTPIQTTTEELLCRGYLLQMMALLTKNRAVLVVISGVLFMLPHLANPEVASGFLPMALYYFAVGCFLTLVTMKSNSLEIAMGIHAAVNLFAGLIVNYANSALKTESIFISTTFDPVGSLVSFCIMAVVFWLIMFGGKVSLQRLRIIGARTG